MILFTTNEIRALHSMLIAATGGSDGLREQGLLESAVHSAAASFGGSEIYPSAEEKAARLMYALTGNHAFVDGNKRIGVLAMLTYLRMNHVMLRYTQAELIDLGLSVAAGATDYDGILLWIRSHTA